MTYYNLIYTIKAFHICSYPCAYNGLYCIYIHKICALNHLKQLKSLLEFCPWSNFWYQVINFMIFKTFKTFFVNAFICNQNISTVQSWSCKSKFQFQIAALLSYFMRSYVYATFD